MPKYNLNSQAIILLIFLWLITSDFKSKFKSLKENKLCILSLSIWFFLFLIGLTYSENLELGFKNIQKNLPLLGIPIVIFSVQWSWERIKFLLNWFSFSVICCATFSLIKASYFTYMDFGNYFYNQNLASLLNIHTTYFALFCDLVILFFCYEILFKKSKRYHFLGILFLLGILYLLSSRMGVFALGVGTFILIFEKFLSKAYLAIIPISLIVIGALFSPNFQKREVGDDKFGTTAPTLSTRLLHWQAVFDGVEDNNIFVGAGTGTTKNHIYTSYKKSGFEEGVMHNYNAHNQFLEYFIYFGLVSIFIWIFVFTVWFKNPSGMQHPFFLSTIILIMCFMLTESILERQHGVVIFSLFLSLALSKKKEKNEIHQ